MRSFLAMLVLAFLAARDVHGGYEHSGRKAKLRAVLLTGGCWHNYTFQERQLKRAFTREGATVDWRVIRLPCANSDGELAAVTRWDWARAAGADVVLMNGCYGSKRGAYVQHFVNIVRSGVPLVPIHCALHSFRDASPWAVKKWWRAVGVGSRRHEPLGRCRFRVRGSLSRIMGANGYMQWDEVYVAEKVLWRTKVLAYARRGWGREQPVFWTNLYNGRTRVFGTSLGHSDITWRDSRFLRAVVRGTLWAAGKYNDGSSFAHWV